MFEGMMRYVNDADVTLMIGVAFLVAVAYFACQAFVHDIKEALKEDKENRNGK